jgi:hypothetical protein
MCDRSGSVGLAQLRLILPNHPVADNPVGADGAVVSAPTTITATSPGVCVPLGLLQLTHTSTFSPVVRFVRFADVKVLVVLSASVHASVP